MQEITLKPYKKALTGEIAVPGDKSISHRSIILASIAKGTTTISNFLEGEDCFRTIDAFQKMGVSIVRNGTTVIVNGNGINALKEPIEPLDFGNSGTTTRLMLGLLSGLPFFTTVYGDESLSNRPMDRVVLPLKKMGANINGRASGNLLPLAIKGNSLQAIDYKLPVKSAQVKSAILLAGLLANGITKVTEIAQTRDHTENMLEAFGAEIKRDGLTTIVKGNHDLVACDVIVPGDISSAAFFLVAGTIVPGSKITLKQVGLNKTRTGVIDVLEAMQANITIENERLIGGELVGDINVSYSNLKGTIIDGDIIPRLIDEIPIIALLATQAEGETIIRDASELRVKETDRIKAVTEVLLELSANIEATEDGMIIRGKTNLTGGKISSYHDHRMAMMGAIASLITSSPVYIDDVTPISISYPNFLDDLNHLKEPV